MDPESISSRMFTRYIWFWLPSSSEILAKRSTVSYLASTARKQVRQICARKYEIREALHRVNIEDIPPRLRQINNRFPLDQDLSGRVDIFLICMVWRMLPGGSPMTCMIYSRTRFPGWICATQIMHDASQWQVKI